MLYFIKMKIDNIHAPHTDFRKLILYYKLAPGNSKPESERLASAFWHTKDETTTTITRRTNNAPMVMVKSKNWVYHIPPASSPLFLSIHYLVDGKPRASTSISGEY